MTRFERLLQEALAGPPTIVDVTMRPTPNGAQLRAIALLQDGNSLELFRYDPSELTFTPQELVGLSVRQARQLKERKLDQFIGFEQF